jgi:hypothetical protein
MKKIFQFPTSNGFHHGISTSCAPGILAMGLALLAGCGGGSGASTAPAPPFQVVASAPTLKVQGETRLQATDGQGQPVPVDFSVVEAGGGSVDAAGRYVAPATPGVYHVQARAASGAAAQAALTVEGFRDGLQRQADLLASRVSHTASPLADGSVLVLGGIESSRAERYLPASGTFVDAGETGQRRWSHTASPLAGGAWLFLGGLGVDPAGSALRALDGATLYQDGSFTALAARMPAPRYDHRSVALADGRILVTGGLPLPGSDVSALASAELFDPVRKVFTPTGAMGLPRAGHTATVLRDGRVLVVGGRDGTCLFTCGQRTWRDAELYDPATGAFTAAGTPAQARFDHTATLLPDGRVLIAGGTTPDLAGTDVSSLVEAYDPASNQFQTLGALRRPRSEHTATLLGDGTVLLAGGRTYSSGENTLATATVEAFDPVTGLSRLATSDVTTRYRHAAARLASGQVMLLGGSEGGGAIRIVERFD